MIAASLATNLAAPLATSLAAPLISVDLMPLAPVAIISAAVLVLLLADSLVKPTSAKAALAVDAVAALALGAAGLAVARLAVLTSAQGPAVTLCPSAPAVQGSCSYVVSSLTLSLQALVLVVALAGLLMARDGSGARDRVVHHALVLASVAGALTVAAGRDLATLVVALELSTVPMIGLVALRRDARGAQAAFTLLVTAIGSLGVMLLGVALLYLATGTLFVEPMAATLAGDAFGSGGEALAHLAQAGAILVVAGIGFKVSAVPFHGWTSDVYAGAPTPISLLLSTLSKVAGVSALLVFLGLAVQPLAAFWGPVLGVLAAVTMTVGNLMALRAQQAIRLLAFSAIAQTGWVLLPLMALAAPGLTQPGVARVLEASLGYLIAYVAAGLVAFTVVILVSRHHAQGESHELSAYDGLIRREPVAALALGLSLAALAGLPPGILGLIAKVVALRPVVASGLGPWMWVLASIAAINVILGLAYYARWALRLVSSGESAAPLTWRVRPAEGLVLGGGFALLVVLSLAGEVISHSLPGLLR